MYLVSIYFDNESSTKIQRFINKAAAESGNSFMIDNKVPPHITISAFQTNKESEVVELLNRRIKKIKEGQITWASIGVFKSSVVFLAPVLNEYLHNLCTCINEEISLIEDISISRFYMPFQWMPHTTIAKKLNNEELIPAFQSLEKNFTIFSGSITRIALSKTNPKKDIIEWKVSNS